MMHARTLAATVIFAAASAMAACSGSEPTTTAAPSPTPPAVVPLPSGVTAATSLPESVANDAELRKNVNMSSCSKTDNGWEASGTAVNPTGKATTYTVTIFFTTQGATVIDWAQKQVKISAGGTAKWSIQKDFATGPKLLCVLRGVGEAKS